MLTPEQVFSVHPDIIVAVYGTVKGEVIFRDVSPRALNAELKGPPSGIMLAFDLRAENLTEMQKRLSPFTGVMECLIGCYEQFNELIVFHGERYLVSVFTKETDVQTMRNSSDKLRNLLAKA